MAIRVLGPIELTDERGDPVGALSARQRRLVAALTVDAGVPIAAERLVHRVWDDDELPAGGTRALHTRLSRLRPHLSAAGVELETHGQSYVLDVGEALDAVRFEELIETARTAAAEGDAEASVARLDEALSLWRGGAYADVAGLEWAEAEITRLEEQRAAAREHRFAALMDMGRHTQVVPAVEEAIGNTPWRDRLRLQFALALYRSGRQAEALRSLSQYRRDLAEELGLEPGPELRELEAKILAQDPELAIGAPSVRAVSGYQFHEVVGEGAFAVVWRATQPALDRQVAIKQIRGQLANRPEFIRRFEAEAQLVASLEHPFIVPLHDYWREPDAAYLAMRWLKGGTLSSRLLDGPLQHSELPRLIRQIGSALRTAHLAGVVHRDVKSSNILLDEEGNAFLGDFGIAFGAGDDDVFAQAMSTGSPAYASPEQLRRDDLDERSDLYAFGIVLFEASTGRLPFVASSQAEMVRAQLDDPVPAPSSVSGSCPPWLDDVVARCCAKDREDRFADVDELLSVVPTEGEVGRTATTATHTASSTTAATFDGRNPYKGLRSFAETDAADFHGRRGLIERFLDVLSRPGQDGRLLVAVGASGSGKSSAVRAGLIPALRRGELPGSEQWLTTTMMPGSHPFEELEAALLRVASSPGSLVEPMVQDERGIARALRRVVPDDDTELLLVIDQLEELFTLTDPDRRRAFLDGLTTALREPSARLRVVATIRADFWDRPLQHRDLAAMLESAAVTVGPLGADELERAIAEPARRCGVEFAPGLIARLIADVADQPGALPLLQFTLTELFETQHDGRISIDAYESFGGIEGALAAHAERTHERADDRTRDGMRRVVGELVTLGEGVSDTRRRVLLRRVADDEASAKAVDLLGDARLLTFDHEPTTREPTVEIAHEALLSAWPRLRTWIDEDRDELRARRQLSDAATDWEQHDRNPDLLYRGSRLDDAEELTADVAHRLGQAEVAFLAASREQVDNESARARRRTRVLQGLLGLAAVLLVVAMIAGFVAIDQRDDAETARTAADLDRLAAAAPGLAESDPRLALLMAAEAHSRADTADTLGSLQRTLLSNGPILGYLGDPDHSYRDVHWIDDSTVVAVHLGGIEVFDLRTGARTFEHEVEVPEARGIRAAGAGGYVAFGVSPDGQTVAVGTVDDEVEVVDVVTGDVLTISHPTTVRSIAFHPDGSEMATGDLEGVVRVFEPGSTEARVEIVAHPERGGEHGDALAALGIFDTTLDPELGATLDWGVHSLEYDARGNLVTAVTPVIRRWDTASGEQIGDDLFPPTDLSQIPSQVGVPGQITTLIDAVDLGLQASDGIAIASRNYVLNVGLDGSLQSQIWLPTERPDTNTTIAGSALAPGGTWIIWLSDGRIRSLDDDGTPRMTVQPALVSPSALETAPSGTRAVGAADGGLVVVGLTGQRTLADGLARRLEGEVTTISDNGALISENALTGGPTVFHERSSAGWDERPFPPEITRFAARVPYDVTGQSVVEAFDPGESLGAPNAEAIEAAMRLRLLDVDTGEQRFEIAGLVWMVEISPDGRLLARDDGLTIVVTDMETETVIATLPALAELPVPAEPVLGGTFVRSLEFSPDGGRLVATAQDGRIAMWDTASWAAIDVSESLESAVVASFSPDGRYVGAVDPGGSVALHDAATLEVVRTMPGLTVTDPTWGWLDWSADGRYLLSVVDGVPRLWDIEQGVQIGDPFPLTIGTRPGAASGDEIRLVTIEGSFLNVWNLDTDSWAAIACRAAGRNMTLDEWERVGPSGEPYRATCPQFPPGT